MLKPRKKITQKEIQRDPFLESVDKAQAHLEDHRSNYLKGAVAVIIILLGYNILNEKNVIHGSDSSAALGQALIALDRSDMSNAEFQLESVLNDYEGTEGSSVAGYYLGKIKYEAEDYTGADKYLRHFIKDDPVDLLFSSAILMLAHIEAEGNDFNAAIAFLDKGLKYDKQKHKQVMLKLAKAEFVFENGDPLTARQIVEGVLAEEKLSSTQKQDAELVMGKIVG